MKASYFRVSQVGLNNFCTETIYSAKRQEHTIHGQALSVHLFYEFLSFRAVNSFSMKYQHAQRTVLLKKFAVNSAYHKTEHTKACLPSTYNSVKRLQAVH